MFVVAEVIIELYFDSMKNEYRLGRGKSIAVVRCMNIDVDTKVNMKDKFIACFVEAPGKSMCETLLSAMKMPALEIWELRPRSWFMLLRRSSVERKKFCFML
ncbi:MAG: hypothetical protein HUJ51_06875 [Eggerthellaceae bacterium]|nr:hypothetical protein [Eggerthellaceae bacterium]